MAERGHATNQGTCTRVLFRCQFLREFFLNHFMYIFGGRITISASCNHESVTVSIIFTTYKTKNHGHFNASIMEIRESDSQRDTHKYTILRLIINFFLQKKEINTYSSKNQSDCAPAEAFMRFCVFVWDIMFYYLRYYQNIYICIYISDQSTIYALWCL